MLNGRDIRQTPLRLGVALANFYRHAAELIHDVEPGFVRQIVANEYGLRPLKRRLLHKRRNRFPFIDPTRLNLHHALTQLQCEDGVTFDNPLRQR
ncbi:Uncharacterised protein [Raoultella ornithinolytica]|nr:Uncharacterised protein [Raoultella ornithinolytica]